MLLVLLPAVMTHCAGIKPVRAAAVRKEMAAVIQDVSRDRRSLSALRSKRIGVSGFFYVIDSEGTVVFHPQAVLIGSNLRKYGFAAAVTGGRSGCLRYSLRGKSYLLFFEPLGKDEFLCLSLPEEELAGPAVPCSEYREKEEAGEIDEE